MYNNFNSSSRARGSLQSSSNRNSYSPYSPSSSSFSNSGGGLSNHRGSDFRSGSSLSGFNSGRLNSGFGSNSGFGNNSSFGSNRSPFGGSSGNGGYALMNSPFSNRPSSMNRPISVYGNNTGFYFPSNNSNSTFRPRQNESISFNQTQQILTPPVDTTYDQSYTEPTYDQNYDQSYDQSYEQSYDQQYDQSYDQQQDYYDEQSNQGNVGASGFDYYFNILKELETGCNGSEVRAAVLVDQSGQIISQGYNYLDENGQEYEAEQYAIPENYYSGGAAGCTIYATSSPSPKIEALILDSGVSAIYMLAADEHDEKRIEKQKDFKKSKKFFEKNNIAFDVIKLS